MKHADSLIKYPAFKGLLCCLGCRNFKVRIK